VTERDTFIITGRSDATLNRGGVRLGTSEFYAVLDGVTGIADSLVVHLEDDEGGMGQLILFVVFESGDHLTNELEDRIRSTLRSTLSPRHVPDRIVQLSVIPRNISGKRLEVPVKRFLLGSTTAESLDGVDSKTVDDLRRLARWWATAS
jgi:acetoacetyl-CoA synthetase